MQKLHAPKGGALRTPQTFLPKTQDDDEVTFENYDDTDYGYLRLVVDPQQLRIEYHPASDGIAAKTPDDAVTVDLSERTQTVYTPNDLGYPARAHSIRSLYDSQSEEQDGNPPTGRPPARKARRRRRS